MNLLANPIFTDYPLNNAVSLLTSKYATQFAYRILFHQHNNSIFLNFSNEKQKPLEDLRNLPENTQLRNGSTGIQSSFGLIQRSEFT